MRNILVAIAIALPAAVSRLPVAAPAADPPVALTRAVAGLNLPVHITNAGDGSGRIFSVGC